MKVVIQRVSEASVSVSGGVISSIKKGLLVLVGFSSEETEENFEYMIKKILHLRVFSEDSSDQDKLDKSVLDNNYEILIVSQFTLYADCKKGNRPSFTKAMKSDLAKELYGRFVSLFRSTYSHEKIKEGQFGADMQVKLINDGPVTIIIEK